MQREVYELVSAIVLDPEIALEAASDAYVISQAVDADEMQTLSIARGEAWRQLRARNVFLHDVPTFDAHLDPVAALTVMERTVLELSVRMRFNDESVAHVVGSSLKVVQKEIATARKELARAAIAGALLTNVTKCPVTSQAQMTLGAELTRGQAMNLVSHSAECSICVPVLRTVDRQIMQNYIDVPMAQLPPDFSTMLSKAAEPLVARARLVDGYAPRESEAKRNPRQMAVRAGVLGFASAVLIVVALLVSR